MTQVSQSRQRGHISRDFVGARGETGSLFCWTWCCNDGTRDNCEEAENGPGTGESRPRGGKMQKPHPEQHSYLWLSTVFYYL